MQAWKFAMCINIKCRSNKWWRWRETGTVIFLEKIATNSNLNMIKSVYFIRILIFSVEISESISFVFVRYVDTVVVAASKVEVLLLSIRFVQQNIKNNKRERDESHCKSYEKYFGEEKLTSFACVYSVQLYTHQ